MIRGVKLSGIVSEFSPHYSRSVTPMWMRRKTSQPGLLSMAIRSRKTNASVNKWAPVH